MQAIHLGSQYLVHEVFANSTYGQILRLKSVCWLDIHANFYVSNLDLCNEENCCTKCNTMSMQGVPAGEYQVVWRMMKLTGGQAGFGSSEVSLSVHGRRVHPSATKCNEKDDALTYPMQHFNSLPANQWHDICGGRLDINVFANITAKMWCHSGEWKHGLAWDCVRLVDVRQPVAPELQETISTLPADADTAVQSAQAAANWCRIA